MKEGKIVKVKYNEFGNIVYKIKLYDNTNIESIEYSKHDGRLKENDEVEIEVDADGKAKILDNTLTKVESRKMKTKDCIKLITIVLIFLLICVLWSTNIIKRSTILLFLGLLMISGWLRGMIFGYLIHKRGQEEIVQVLDKEECYISNEGRSTRTQQYYYNLTVQLNNGKKIKGPIPFCENTTKIKIGDSIKIKVYKNKFITEE